MLQTAFLLLAFVPAMAQSQVKVTGIVTGPDGAPLFGASVVQKGTTNGVVTELDGSYAITVAQGVELEYSYVGYVTQTFTAKEGKIDVTLVEDNFFIEETVVVGYGVQKKSDVTGAIASVRSADINNRTITTAEQALQGKTSGVALITTSGQPGSTPTIRIRGFSSNGTSDPLYVVDGLLVSNIRDIDPNNIESIAVFKDAASAAIYRAQAGNGVVLVSTKKGANGTSSISYDFQYTINQLGFKPQLLNSKQAIKQNYESSATYTEADEKALITNGVWDGQFSTNWYDIGFETAPTFHHTLNFQGANKKGSYFASLSSYSDNGIICGDRDYFKRLSLMVNGDYQVKDWLKIGTNINMNKTTCSGISDGSSNSIYGSMISNVMSLSPYWRSTYPADKLPTIMQGLLDAGNTLFKDEKGDYYMTLGAGEQVHPMVSVLGYNKKNQGYNLQGTAFLNFNPFDGFVFTSRLGVRFNQTQNYNYTNKFYGSSSVSKTKNEVSRTSSTIFYYQWENFANYQKRFGQHDVSAMAGMSFSDNEFTYVIAGVDQVMKDDPLYADVSYGAGGAAKSVGGYQNHNRKLSYFARLGYNYAEKYYIQASFRADAADTSILPKENRWGFFPSVSLGWVVSKEDFFKNLSAPINFLKIRASWGQNGSTSNLSGYLYSNAISTNALGYSFVPDFTYQISAFPNQTYNPELKWETSEQFDVGFDLRAFSDRFTFGFDWYRKETKDLIVSNITIPAEAGNKSAPVNAGNVLNSGFEFDLGWKDRVGEFGYSISANLATLNNKVTYLTPALSGGRINGGSAQAAGGSFSAFEVGYPVWYFRGYEVEKIDDTGNPVFKDHDGVDGIDDNDKVMLGKPMPDFTYGATVSLDWKGIDLTVFGSGVAGNQIFMALGYNTISYPLYEMWKDRWTADKSTSGKYAKPGVAGDKYRVSDAYVFNGSYFKIKQIQLGYTLPKRITKLFFVERLHIYAALNDWFVFTKYPGLDPEVSATSTSGMGVDYGMYPNTKKTVFGISITF